MNFRKVKADFDGSMWMPLNDSPIPEYVITDDAIPGFIVQRFEQFDADPPITGAHKLFGQLTYGNQHPDLILSSEKMMKRVVSCIIPKQVQPSMYGCNFGFNFNHAVWSHPENLSFEIPDGWVFMLNRIFPENPRLNGCMKAAWMEASNG